ncbi:MAG TPA: pyridoxal-phosphate dependent enzyme [Desulfosarcina sp.]|nr:pyridoxal-phosphate dependent enzyme [Desulfosarcina sp.]
MKTMPALVDVYQASKRIQSMIRRTPLLGAPELARRTGAAGVHLKMECLQHTGAFKVRGAANKILSLDASAAKRGVVTFSTGNHGKAVAYVAGRTGIAATVCLSEHVPAYRAASIQNLGATVAVKGRSQDEAEDHYRELVRVQGFTPVVPFDDPLIIAGQGTTSLEIMSALPDTEVLLIPLSGGGLLAGMAMAAKSINPDIRVVGLSIEQSPAMLESLKAGKPVQVEERPSIADSLLGGIGVDNRYTLPMVRQYVDDHVLVSEADIEAGMFHLFETHRTVAEGAAAVGVGAMLSGRVDVAGKRVVTVVTGGSVASAAYLTIINAQLKRNSHP